mgnify:CR=1 FL=1
MNDTLFIRLVDALQSLTLGTETMGDSLPTLGTETLDIHSEFSVYIGGIGSVEPVELQHHFASCGAIKQVLIPVKWTGEAKDFAYVEFTNPISKDNALLLNQSEFRGRTLTVKEKRTKANDKLSVYVGGVDWSVNPTELQHHFAPCGSMKRVTIPIDKWSRKAKGYAFIEFVNQNSKDNILLLNQSEFRGRILTVKDKRTNIHGFNRRRRRKGRWTSPY